MLDHVRAAAVAVDARPGHLMDNLARIAHWTGQAAEAGAQLVLFQELSLSGFIPNHPTGNHDTWLRETGTRLTELRAATAAGDGERVAGLAHAMRSGSAALGALPLAAALTTAENDLRAGRPVDLAALLPRLEHEVARAVDGMQALREGS